MLKGLVVLATLLPVAGLCAQETSVTFVEKVSEDKVKIRINTTTFEEKIVDTEVWENLFKDDNVWPRPDEAIDTFYERYKTTIPRMHNLWVVDGRYSELAVQLNYDGIYVYWLLMKHFEDDPETVKMCKEIIEAIWADSEAYFLRNGPPGYYNYNVGLLTLGEEWNIENALLGAKKCANEAAYAPIYSHNVPSWWDNWNKSRLIREHSLALHSHLTVMHYDYWNFNPTGSLGPNTPENTPKLNALRLENCIRRTEEFIIPTLDTWLETTELGTNDYAPFYMSLCARSLIKFHDMNIKPELNPVIREKLVALARKICDDAWRETGFFYRYKDGSEGAAHDLNMLCFPFIAQAAAWSNDLDLVSHATILVENSHRAWISGFKQFNQNYLWVEDGLKDMGW